ncbi:hypothetical protein CONPUDRAFT_157204 [Coniophora puteana RWD-64-598 SS2]|uniref:Uncharacterized protein n=1 Tax=Coniophora puteana (strain RWD-64-598) TaxID=741705 RepID=A0A5M3MFK0_CONPW|nr:uncharacterized protein CONPUDRAFT_157204 [Coniophora puteana RWD-64-598 SS2]EIW78039.1 hypothetical protein CONPUDRAFT_157204 [Coniophora puteana RWD-64-598 SS2]
MHFTFSAILAIAGASFVAASVDAQWSFDIYQTNDCSDGLPPLSQSGSGKTCSPQPEFGFFGVKVHSAGGCTINFVGEGCSDVLTNSPGKIPADGKCHPLPSGTTSYAVVCN